MEGKKDVSEGKEEEREEGRKGKGMSGEGEEETLIIGLKQQLSKTDNSSLNTTHSARNLGFIFDENLTFFDQITSLSKSCYSHIRQLHCIRHYLDSKTASTIASSIIHSKLDCNPLYYNPPKSQINRLQQIQNCLARTLLNLLISHPSSDLCTGSRLGP